MSRRQLHLVSTYGMDQSLECRELGREGRTRTKDINRRIILAYNKSALCHSACPAFSFVLRVLF